MNSDQSMTELSFGSHFPPIRKSITLLTKIGVWRMILILSACLSSCRDDITPPPPEIKQSIVLIQSYYDSGPPSTLGNYRMGVWCNNKIYCLSPLREIIVNQDIGVTHDSILFLYQGIHRFVSINKAGTKLLLVRSIYADVSIGGLREYDISSGALSTIKDSTFSISSALYLEGDQKCIYYSYGNPNKSISAGYYILDLTTGKDSLFFPHSSPVQENEIANGFDISPDNQKLLIPLHYLTTPPKIMEYDLATGNKETLNVSFDKQFLWLRYNPAGTKIVYSNYPWGSSGSGSSAADTSEIGIINRSTLAKSVLNVNTAAFHPNFPTSVNIFPSWSPDGKNIIYGSAPGPAIEPPGGVGPYSLYVLKNAD